MKQKLPKVVLIGAPNVGKSVIFNYLTGAYVVVSNYPGTTVDVARGQAKINGKVYEVIDTPGIYSLSAVTDEERVTLELLRKEKPDLVIHIIDAKNIRRMLATTLQLMDGGFPLLLILNIMDEAEQYGIHIQVNQLSELLGLPVVAASAAANKGMKSLIRAIGVASREAPEPIFFSEQTEKAIHDISKQLTVGCGFNKRLTALLVLQGDRVAEHMLSLERHAQDIRQYRDSFAEQSGKNPALLIALERQGLIDKVVQLTVTYGKGQKRWRSELLDRITCQPLTGLPLLCIVLYFGLYQFVGLFGAGVLVDYLNNTLFLQMIIPIVEAAVEQYIPSEWLQSFIIGEYGLFSLGIRYAVAIILPIVGTFFVAFALLEDCGYLPRLAMLVDRFFKALGLNGRAVIPIALGFGCGTMAVMVTRTLETRRERVIATFLLSLTIPCSAQLGVVLSLLAHNERALGIWLGYIVLIFAFSGWLSAKLTGSGGSAFYMELPPLRVPAVANVMKKAYSRMLWYFAEILPIFILTSSLLWIGDKSGVLVQLIAQIEPVMKLIGLPSEAAEAFLLGFFRRDYGAAGLYDMVSAGQLTDQQLVVAAVTLTLFMPCVAQFAVMIKERGLATALVMSGMIAVTAIASGWLVNQGVMRLWTM
ncbi:ferrous iron transport protein B [Anaerospora sp.]|jgi:ferrous iron transport protein B|uniref:ferrous iron transport protein B n=1 Tax=Anaerospora sp. TaxID=1960278 RepID=UPI00289DE7E3|nr:ferrous iron transport protein B [Anaerospora sp.]